MPAATIDAVFLLAGAIVVGLTAVIARAAAKNDEDVAQALVAVLGWAEALWRAVFVGVLALALVVVVEALWRRRWDLVRDLLAAAAVVVGAA